MKRILLIGPPGSGKGEVQRFLEDEYGADAFDTGTELKRWASGMDTPEKRKLHQKLVDGEFATIEQVQMVLRAFLERQQDSDLVLLAGLPRTREQAVMFRDEMERGLTVHVMLVLEAPVDVLGERIRSRLVCTQCRAPGRAEEGEPGTCDRCGAEMMVREEDRDPLATRKRTQKVLDEIEDVIRIMDEAGCATVRIDAARSLDEVLGSVSQVVRSVTPRAKTPSM